MEMQLSGATEAELQQDLQRFAGALSERIEQAAEQLADARNPRWTALALHRALHYETAAFEIATGRVPEVNLLDMIVFVTLCRDVLERHWIPNVLGDFGRQLLASFDASDGELRRIADKVLRPDQQRQLQERIRAWQTENAGQVHVESVRLADFSRLYGEAAGDAVNNGLLASVRSATRSADDALRLGERALFLAQRAPLSLRLHVRIGALEILADSIEQLGPSSPLDRAIRRWAGYAAVVAFVGCLLFWLVRTFSA